MANNERIIDLRDKLIKGYEEEIDLLKQQNTLLRRIQRSMFQTLLMAHENREKNIYLRESLIENYRNVNELLKEQNMLLQRKNALLSEMVERQNQILEE